MLFRQTTVSCTCKLEQTFLSVSLFIRILNDKILKYCCFYILYLKFKRINQTWNLKQDFLFPFHCSAQFWFCCTSAFDLFWDTTVQKNWKTYFLSLQDSKHFFTRQLQLKVNVSLQQSSRICSTGTRGLLMWSRISYQAQFDNFQEERFFSPKQLILPFM